jgi:hypothetical protein
MVSRGIWVNGDVTVSFLSSLLSTSKLPSSKAGAKPNRVA